MASLRIPFTQINDSWPPHPCIPICLSNPNDDYDIYYPTLAIIDTGAVRSAIPEAIAKDLMHNSKHPDVKKKDPAIGIGGYADVVEHTFSLDVMNFSDSILFALKEIKIDVIETDLPIVLGMEDFISKYVKTIYFDEQYILMKPPKKRRKKKTV